MHFILKTILIGIGATVAMDIWSFILKLFNISSLDYRFLGRWIGHFPKGQFFHDKIFNATPVKGELILGYISHYLIGISFAFLLIIFYGKGWVNIPTLKPAVIIGLVTIVAPFFILQPAFGFGIALTDLPNPFIGQFKSLLVHLIYGLGMYGTAVLINKITV